MIFENLGRPTYRKIEPMQLSKLVYCGPRPYSPRQLVEKNIRMSLSLQRGWYEIFTDSPQEKAEMDSSLTYDGMQMFGVPLSDIWRPRRLELKSIFKMLLETKEPIYFHCLHGKDRTGYVRAIYRVLVNDWTVEAAKAEMFNQGFHKFPYLWWTWKLEGDAHFIRESLTQELKMHRVDARVWVT